MDAYWQLGGLLTSRLSWVVKERWVISLWTLEWRKKWIVVGDKGSMGHKINGNLLKTVKNLYRCYRKIHIFIQNDYLYSNKIIPPTVYHTLVFQSEEAHEIEKIKIKLPSWKRCKSLSSWSFKYSLSWL